MPIYEYKGLNAKGKATSGIKDADSPRSLKERLKRDGVFLTQFTETARSGKVRQVGGEQAGSREVRFQLFSSVKSIEIAEFTRQMATLMRSGIPMLDSINAIVDQTENPKFKRILSQVKRSVAEIAALADSLRQHPKAFSELYTNMVAAGESSGNLDVVMNRLAEFTEKQGQYLAFIYAFTKVNGLPPAEAEIARFFSITPPSVHRMIVELHRKGLITRMGGRARTIRVLLEPENLPVLR